MEHGVVTTCSIVLSCQSAKKVSIAFRGLEWHKLGLWLERNDFQITKLLRNGLAAAEERIVSMRGNLYGP